MQEKSDAKFRVLQEKIEELAMVPRTEQQPPLRTHALSHMDESQSLKLEIPEINGVSLDTQLFFGVAK